MVEKKKDAGRLDPNKSQIKGSKARTRHKLNLSTSLLHSRDMRKVFGAFPFADGVRFPEIPPLKQQD